MLAFQNQVRVGDQWLGYTLPTGASLTPPTTEVTLPRSGWTVSASASDSGEPASNAIDGDPATRWSTGHGMQPGDWFQLDLGSRQTFNQIVLDTTASPGDFVRQYEVSVSDDGTNWSQPDRDRPGQHGDQDPVPAGHRTLHQDRRTRAARAAGGRYTS